MSNLQHFLDVDQLLEEEEEEVEVTREGELVSATDKDRSSEDEETTAIRPGRWYYHPVV